MQAEKKRFKMNSKGIVAIALIVLGLVVLAYSGITLKTPGKPIDLGSVHIATTNRHFIPPVAGTIMLVGGVVLLFAGGGKKD
ncbi:MAG TPA: DUF3185 domain-containing protein [Verrucomicrobia bacterium]|nr:DUF3185 domain-containing protein [Verrucomicrobiota bacterium]